MVHRVRPFPAGATGFTLAELTLAIALVAILMAFLLPALHNAREVARKHADATNLKQLAVTVGQYAMVNHNQVPQAFGTIGCHYYGYACDNRASQWMKYSGAGWAKGFLGLALMYQSDLVDNAQIFYSPTASQIVYTNASRGWNAAGYQQPSGTYILSHYFYRYSMKSNNRRPIGVLTDCEDNNTVDKYVGDINKLVATDNAFLWGSYKTSNFNISLREGYNIGYYDGAVIFHNAWKRYPGAAKSWAEELDEHGQGTPPRNMWYDYTDCWGYGTEHFVTYADATQP